MHSDVKARWLAGDPIVAEGMTALGALADKLKEVRPPA